MRKRQAVIANRHLVFAVLLAVSVTRQTQGALTLWHKLDEISGAVATDSSGNANNGTYTGAPTLGVTAPHRFGVNFPADNQYVTAPASTTLNAIGVSNADFSVAFWVKPNAATGGWRPLFHKGSVDTERGPGIWLNPGSNRIHFRISTTANWNEGSDSVADLPYGTWSHVAFVKAGNQWKCYVNGVLDTAFTLSGTTTGNNGPIYVADDPWYAGSNTSIDDVRLYNTALSDGEVKGLYGVVGYWKLSETTGTTAADSTNAGNTGTYTNGPLLNQPGIKDMAVSFDGVDDYVGVPDSASLKATDSVTMAAWVRPTASTNIDRIIINKEGEYEIAITDTNEIKWAFANTSPGWAWHQTGTFIPNDKWSHIVVTYDGAQAKTYLNGVLVETLAATGDIGDANVPMNELRIGGRMNNPSGKYFGGVIDEVYVYTRAINAVEAANLYGLVGHWKFAEGSGAAAADSTAFANNATLSGGATWETNCAGKNALQTNGAGAMAQTNASFTPPSVGTVAFWMRASGPHAAIGRLCGVGGDWEIRQATDGKLMFDFGASPYVGNEPFSTLDPVDTNGKWYHIAAVFNDVDNSYSVYIDGKLRTSGISPVDLIPQAAGILSFGIRTGTSEYWQGALRDFRVYNRQLGAGEIAELYGLACQWKLDETSGTVASDSSGFGRDGTVVGTATWTTGTAANCLELDGATRAERASLLGTPKNVTLAAWVRLVSPDSGGAEVISLGDYFAIRLDAGGTSGALFYDGSSSQAVMANRTFAGTGWHHFAAVFNDDQDVCSFYVDGVEAATTFTAVTIPYTGRGTKMTIGTHGNGSALYDLMGRIDDVRVYERALCPTDILSLYNEGKPKGVRVIKVGRNSIARAIELPRERTFYSSTWLRRSQN